MSIFPVRALTSHFLHSAPSTIMKGTLGIFIRVAAETQTLEDHLILTVLHMMEATGPIGILIFIVPHLEDAETGEIGMNLIGMMIDILGGNFPFNPVHPCFSIGLNWVEIQG